MSLATPLKKVRGFGSAKSGTDHWWLQRVTAIANLPLVLFTVWFVVSNLGASRAEVAAAVANPFVALFLGLNLLSVIWHMRLGMQVIIEDYVHNHKTKIAALLANTFFTVALLAAGLYAILRMNFGL